MHASVGGQEQGSAMSKIAGAEKQLDADDFIVSKTNLKGHITYANDVFLDIAEFDLDEVIGKPHSVVRNDAMPRCVFQLLWERLEAGREVFAYVVNKTKHNDHYWVFAHVTPSRNAEGKTVGYHSNRRRPAETALAAIKPVYALLLDEEASHSNRKEGQRAGYALLQKLIADNGGDYDRFVLSL